MVNQTQAANFDTINLKDQSNRLPASDLKLGSGALDEIEKLEKKIKAGKAKKTKLDILTFQNDCGIIIYFFKNH